MADPIILPSFAAGELSPSLWARVDLEKYHVGAALLRNFFVDFRGGASNRAGTQMVGPCVDWSTKSTNRLIPFTFSTVQTYMLVFGDQTMRVIMNGGLVLEDAIAIQSISNAVPAVAGCVGHGYAAGDLIEVYASGMPTINARLLVVRNPTANTFSLEDLFGNAVDTTSAGTFGGGYCARVYTIPTPFSAADLALLKFVQSADTMTFTHNSYTSRQLTRTGHAAWTFSEINFQSKTPTPTGLAVTASTPTPKFVVTSATKANPGVFKAANNTFENGDEVTFDVSSGMTELNTGGPYYIQNSLTDGTFTLTDSDGTAVDTSSWPDWGAGTASPTPTTYKFVVTAIGANGLTESLPSAVVSVSAATLSTTNGSRISLQWDAQTSATVFNVFRTPENIGGAPVDGALFGFIGSVTAQSGTNTFIDNNIDPDFTNCPPQGNDPFANGNNPACSTYFQQRQVFGGLVEQPDGMALSRSGDFLNMDYSSPSKDDDAIQVTIASQQVNAIKHLLPMNSLIALTASGAWRIDGGTTSAAITPSAFEAVPQAYNGCADVPPIIVNTDILYVQAKGATVRDLSYNFYVNIYTGQDITVLARHLVDGHEILEWAYAEEPYKVIWAVRDDGILLSLTYIKEQDVTAWCRSDTAGNFKSTASISEGNEDAVYFIVERLIQGKYVQCIERMASRQLGGDPARDVPGDLSKAWFVDCGKQLPLTNPAATLSPAAASGVPGIDAVNLIYGGSGYTAPTVVDQGGSGASFACTVVDGVITAITPTARGIVNGRTNLVISDPTGTGAVASAIVRSPVTMTADADVFSAANVGDVVRIQGGMGTVLSVPSARQIIVDLTASLTRLWRASAGDWSIATPVTTVRGLDHLEGETVSILADGNVQAQQTVQGGAVTLQHAASSVVVGLPYQSQLKSLYIDANSQPTIQGRRKNVSAVSARLLDSRGVKIGQTFDDLHPFKERNRQPMGQPIQLITGDERVVLDPAYGLYGQICLQQDDPLPVTVLGLIPEFTVGDG